MPEERTFQNLDVSHLPRGQKATGWLPVASRPDGGTWQLPFLYVTGRSEGPTLVVLAGVHGDEYEGIEAIPDLFQHVTPEALRGALLMVPVCNIPAYGAATRTSPVDGLNLARVFPGDPDGSITLRIASWLTQKLFAHTDFLIDLHSGGFAYNIPTLAGYIHRDDRLGQVSLQAARAFGAPILWGHPSIAPGRTLSAATDLGVPSLYTEAPGGGWARPEDVVCFRDGVLNVMKWLDMLEGAPHPRPPTHHLLGDGNIDQAILSPVAGLYRPQVHLLDEVRAGQRLGAVQDLLGQTTAEIIANRDGVVIMLRRITRVRVGDELVHITGYLDTPS